MTKYSASLVIFLVIMLIQSNAIDHTKRPGTWCIQKASSTEEDLAPDFRYWCSLGDDVYCHKIQEGGECYEPNTVFNHASFAINGMYVNKIGGHEGFLCANNSISHNGLIVLTDPSYGNCHFDGYAVEGTNIVPC
ncbi:hypothetical protein QL285_001218 [Trifolium repens]|nr:hypothetical protein QL285_001218 [Trifolium repens]